VQQVQTVRLARLRRGLLALQDLDEATDHLIDVFTRLD